MGNFCDKSTETTLHESYMQVFHRFADSSKPSQSVLLIYELARLARIHNSEENLLKTSCKVVPVTKVAHIFCWRHENRKQSASAREHWCDVSCDIPYWTYMYSNVETNLSQTCMFPLIWNLNLLRYFCGNTGRLIPHHTSTFYDQVLTALSH